MRKYFLVGLAAAGLLLVPVRGFACQQDPSQQNQQPSSPSSAPPSSQQSSAQKPDAQANPSAQSSQPPAVKPDPLVAAARRAREEKKDQTKPAKVFTNDNLPTTGGVSSVGETSATPAADKASGSESSASLDSQEKMWREKFAQLRHKVEQDQQELDVMQRELGVLDIQYYNNPVKAMQQELTRSDINKKTADIEAKKAQIEADKQAISDAEDDLRKSGGDPGWAR
jgi:cytoskeletal protein RodZ